MDYMDIKRKWVNEYYQDNKLTDEDDIDMEELVEWLAKKQVKNCSIPAVVGRSEQFYCSSEEDNKTKCESQCLGCAGLEEYAKQ